MSHWQTGIGVLLVLLASVVQAEGNVTVEGGIPARGGIKSSVEQVPGISRAIFSPVTPEESERTIGSRSAPANLIRPLPALPSLPGAQRAVAAAPAGPASIAELARALKNDPDLIYEYVRNNIEHYPVWGVQKGAVGIILDNQGTAFDQADLMVALLRQAGFTASYIKGQIALNANQVRDWLGVDTGNICAVRQLLANGQCHSPMLLV